MLFGCPVEKDWASYAHVVNSTLFNRTVIPLYSDMTFFIQSDYSARFSLKVDMKEVVNAALLLYPPKYTLRLSN